MARPATRAAHAKQTFVSEKSLRIRLHDRREHGEHSLLRAPAFPAIESLLEQRKLLGFVERAEGIVVERRQPFEVTTGLCRDHHELFRCEAKEPGRALLALRIEVLNRAENVIALEFH